MAKCINCSNKAGFLNDLCDSCQKTIDDKATKEKLVAAIDSFKLKEDNEFLESYDKLIITHDQMEDTTFVLTPVVRINKTNFEFRGNSNKDFWMIAYHTVAQWTWLSYNKTIFLFSDGNRFVQETIPLADSQIASAYQLNELHFVSLTPAIHNFESEYKRMVEVGEPKSIALRIGNQDFVLPHTVIRNVAALVKRINEF